MMLAAERLFRRIAEPETYAQRLLGEIEARREPPEREHAEAYYQQALALADALGMRPLWPTATAASAPCTP